jgi:hypothetical protein
MAGIILTLSPAVAIVTVAANRSGCCRGTWTVAPDFRVAICVNTFQFDVSRIHAKVCCLRLDQI